MLKIIAMLFLFCLCGCEVRHEIKVESKPSAAFEEGKKARQNGTPHDANPYAEDRKRGLFANDYRDWLRGWSSITEKSTQGGK